MPSFLFALVSDVVSLAPAKAVVLATDLFLVNPSNNLCVIFVPTEELRQRAVEKASCSCLRHMAAFLE